MIRKNKTSAGIYLMIIALFLIISNGCKDGDPISLSDLTNNNDNSGGIVKQISSSESGILETDTDCGLEVMTGAVPKDQNGNDGTVSFSIEINVKLSDLPVPIPSDYTLIGSIVKYGPEAFTFAFPIKIWLPAKSESSPEDIFFIHYNEESEEWVPIMPSDINAEKKTLSISTLKLGYFALVKRITSITSLKKPTPQDTKSCGGIEFCDVMSGSSGNRYYSLTIRSMFFKYAEQEAWYKNRNGVNTLLGASASTPSDATGSWPRHPLRWILPQGTYEMWVTSYSKVLQSDWPTIKTYSIPITVEINRPLTYSWSNTTGFIGVCSLPDGGQWLEGTPDNWPTATIPFGTGEFQATLNWVNSSVSSTDLDLHLYGPNDIHIYFGNKKSVNEELELDRDWRIGYGNAVENIYSLKTMPKGQYSIKVRKYSGEPKSFTVRVIRRGSVQTYYKNLPVNNDNEVTIETFSVR